MKKYVFVDSENNIKGVCTADRELTAGEVYPGMNYSTIEVENDEIINKFSMYEYDGTSFNLKQIQPTQPSQPTDIELIAQGVSEREIQEIVQGQQISDLEIRLITGGL